MQGPEIGYQNLLLNTEALWQNRQYRSLLKYFLVPAWMQEARKKIPEHFFMFILFPIILVFYVCSFLIKIEKDLDFACVYICKGENEHLFRLIDFIQQFTNRYRIIWIKTILWTTSYSLCNSWWKGKFLRNQNCLACTM